MSNARVGRSAGKASAAERGVFPLGLHTEEGPHTGAGGQRARDLGVSDGTWKVHRKRVGVG